MNTKIIATIGNTSSSSQVIQRMIETGMDIARLNMSHCSPDEFVALCRKIRTAAQKIGRKVKILADLQGPRIRVGQLPAEGVKLVEGKLVILTNEPDCRLPKIPFDDPHLHRDIKAGNSLFLASGEFELVVRKIAGNDIVAEVIHGGILHARKGINVPGTKLTLTSPTEQDVKDANFALAQGVVLLAISFVQRAEDVKRLRAALKGQAMIIAKIETKDGVKNIDDILAVSDALMIARGDLGIELPIVKVPYIQKHLIELASWCHKPSITATHMLYSMVANNRPTNAEVGDVTGSVWTGTSAVMLSDETACGKYPIEAVKMMATIVKEAEKNARPQNTFRF